jgi:hypothetical protein
MTATKLVTMSDDFLSNPSFLRISLLHEDGHVCLRSHHYSLVILASTAAEELEALKQVQQVP